MLTIFFESSTSDLVAFRLSEEGSSDGFYPNSLSTSTLSSGNLPTSTSPGDSQNEYTTTTDLESDSNESSAVDLTNDPGYTANRVDQDIDEPSTQVLPLAELYKKISDIDKHEITVVIPGEQVTTQIIKAPKGSKRHVSQAIPYLLEDDLATAVEELHFALGKMGPEGHLLCAVMTKHLLESYLKKLEDAGLKPSIMIPDYWLLPNTDKLTVSEYRQRYLIRQANNTGMVLPVDAPDDLLNEILRNPKIVPEGIEDEDNESEPFSAMEGQISAEIEKRPSLIALPFQLNQQPFNLLQGDYTPATTTANNLAFKPIAIAAAVCTLLFMGYFVVMGWYFKQQSEQLHEEAIATYQKWFPNESRILNIRRQMTAHINNSRGQQQDGLFFDLTQAVSKAVNAENEKALIRHIRYDLNDATLQLELQAKSMGYAHSLQGHIQKYGYGAEVLSANSNDEGVITRIKLFSNSSDKKIK